jgi:hypothetical protein
MSSGEEAWVRRSKPEPEPDQRCNSEPRQTSAKRWPKRTRIKPPERYTPAHDGPYRSELDMNYTDWLRVHEFRNGRAQLSIAELTPKLRAHLEQEMPELRAYFDQRAIDPALANRWREYPDRRKGAAFTIGFDPTTGEGALEPPAPARKPATKPAAQATDDLTFQLARSIALAREARGA